MDAGALERETIKRTKLYCLELLERNLVEVLELIDRTEGKRTKEDIGNVLPAKILAVGVDNCRNNGFERAAN